MFPEAFIGLTQRFGRGGVRAALALRLGKSHKQFCSVLCARIGSDEPGVLKFFSLR